MLVLSCVHFSPCIVWPAVINQKKGGVQGWPLLMAVTVMEWFTLGFDGGGILFPSSLWVCYFLVWDLYLVFFPSQDILKVHYENNNPFLTITSMIRVIEVSHWGNIAVEETVDLKHTGAVLKGPFSRYDYQRQPDSGISSVKSFKVCILCPPLPPSYRKSYCPFFCLLFGSSAQGIRGKHKKLSDIYKMSLPKRNYSR